MRILALDTTAAFGSLALVDDGIVIEESLLHSPEGFSVSLYRYAGLILERHGWTLASVDCFAAAAGPGSFTGVRVGLAAVKGLAEAEGKAAVAVSNLEALAACGSAPLRAALLDARRGEVYAALYDRDLRPVVPETVAKLQPWLESLPQGDIEFICTDMLPFRVALSAGGYSDRRFKEQRALAAAIARIAASRLQAGQAQDPASLDANYVRRSDAELLWRDPAAK